MSGRDAGSQHRDFLGQKGLANAGGGAGAPAGIPNPIPDNYVVQWGTALGPTGSWEWEQTLPVEFDMRGQSFVGDVAAVATSSFTLSTGAFVQNAPGGGGTSGAVRIMTGRVDQTDLLAAGTSSGSMTFQTGDAAAALGTPGESGSFSMGSGPATGGGNTGAVLLESGAGTGAGESGAVLLQSGATVGGDSGAVLFQSGNSSIGVPGVVSVRTGAGGGSARPAVEIGDRVAVVGDSEVMPLILPRSTGIRLDGADLAPNRQVLATQHERIPNVAPGGTSFPDDPCWAVVNTAGSGAGLANYGGLGLFVANGAGVGDGIVLSPQTGNSNAWAGFVADRTKTLLTKRSVHTYIDIANYRLETGLKNSPVLDYGVDSGNGSAAAFFRFDSTAAPLATWVCIVDSAIVAPVVFDSLVPVDADTTYVLAIYFEQGTDDVLFFIDGVLVARLTITGAGGGMGRPYVGASSPGAAVLRAFHTTGGAVSRDDI